VNLPAKKLYGSAAILNRTFLIGKLKFFAQVGKWIIDLGEVPAAELKGVPAEFILDLSRLVATVSGFGQNGPYARLPGFGTLVGSFEPSEINQPTASPFSVIAVWRLPMKRNSSTTSLRMRRTAK
jgi:hypothetical protein